MRKALVSLYIFLLSVAGLAQDASRPESDTLLVPDSLIAVNPGSDCAAVPKDSISSAPQNAFDVYWVTNSIKSGWKVTDNAMIGSGVELCDTAHPFIMPVDGKFWRGCTYYHAGWDIGTAYGTPIQAALYGKVRFAGYCSGYGKMVIVRHYSGMEIYYAHLSRILVAVDQYVNAGDTVGLVGATGRARGNHLHLEFRLKDKALDIADYYVHNDTVVNLYKIIHTSSEQQNPQTTDYYTIVRGDTLYAIARRYGTTVANLCKLNNISSKSTLRIGQRIRIS